MPDPLRTPCLLEQFYDAKIVDKALDFRLEYKQIGIGEM